MRNFLTPGKQSLEQETIPHLIENLRFRAMLASENFFYDYGTVDRYKWLKKNEKIVRAIYG
jgi:NDP-sugar pyrophosphorylase family protein